MGSCDPVLISKQASPPQGGRTYGQAINCREADIFCGLERGFSGVGGVLMVLQYIFLFSFFST